MLLRLQRRRVLSKKKPRPALFCWSFCWSAVCVCLFPSTDWKNTKNKKTASEGRWCCTKAAGLFKAGVRGQLGTHTTPQITHRCLQKAHEKQLMSNYNVNTYALFHISLYFMHIFLNFFKTTALKGNHIYYTPGQRWLGTDGRRRF